MNILKCEHCGYPNELSSEYLTFCGQCGKKLEGNYTAWLKENPSKSFEDFKGQLVHQEPVPISISSPDPPSESHYKKWFPAKIVTGFILLVCMGWIIHSIAASSDKITTWANKYIYPDDYNTELWKTYTGSEGNFEIKFPGEPTLVIQKSDSADLPVDLTWRYTLGESNDPARTYQLNKKTFQPQWISQVFRVEWNPEEMLKLVVADVIEKEKATLQSTMDIVYGLYPGKEFVISTNQGATVIHYRLYLVNGTIYQLSVKDTDPGAGLKAANFYFNSFKLLSYANSEE